MSPKHKTLEHRTMHRNPSPGSAIRTLTAGLPLLLACLALPAPALHAQTVQVTGETLSTIGVYADQSPQLYDIQSLGPNQKFTSGINVKAAAGNCWAEYDATIRGGRATTIIRGEASRVGTVRGKSRSFSNRATLGGSPRVGYTMTTPNPTAGTILVKMSPRAYSTWGSSAYVTTTVKIGNTTLTTNNLWAVPLTKSVGVTLDSAGTLVDVAVSGSGSSSASRHPYEMKVEVWFQPLHGATNYGKSCTHLSATFPDRDSLKLDISSSMHRENAFLLLGQRRTAIVMDPIYGCNLLVDSNAIVPIPGQTNGGGWLEARYALPNQSFDMLLQVAIYSRAKNELQLTDGVDLRIVRR